MRDDQNLGSGLDINLELGNFNMKPSASFDPMVEFHRTLEDRNAQPSLSFDDEVRDGPPQEHHDDFPREEKLHATTESPMEVSSVDVGSMTFCPVNEARVNEMFGTDEPFFGLRDPQEMVSRFDGYQELEATAFNDTSIANYDNVASAHCPIKETSSYDDFLPFHNINETSVNMETVEDVGALVVAAPPVTSNAAVLNNTTRTVSPSLNHPAGDYSEEWAQRQGSGDFDFFAEMIHKPDSVQSVSIPNLGLLGQHCIVKTQFGLAVLLNSERPTSGNVPTVRQPTSNVLGARQSNSGIASKRKFQRWSPEEDDILKQAVEIEGGKTINWKRIAAKYFYNVRTGLQCKSRWTKSLKPGINKGAWTPEEDARILKFKQQGMKWSEMSKFLPGRLAEHISDRFNNVLDPTLKKTAWTPEEDKILFREQRRLGNRWTQISHLIPGRSENSVKNRWHNLKVTRERRMRNEALRRKREAELQTAKGEPLPLFAASPSHVQSSLPSTFEV